MVKREPLSKTEEAKHCAVEVLINNSNGPYRGLPRAAGWGYPEPYTRDLMFSILGIAISDNKILTNSIRRVLETLAHNQTEHGHIPSLVHNSEERGSSDTTPLFLFGVAVYRKVTGNSDFLQSSVDKALLWMDYQSPSDRFMVAQQPTSDWRDEQWVMGYGLYVNTIVYSYLRLFGLHKKADGIRREIRRNIYTENAKGYNKTEGLSIGEKPYFALWSYKIFHSQRFDLLGNSLAILSGIATQARALRIIDWIERECVVMRKHNELNSGLPPNFFPFIKPGDPDWYPRNEIYNKPGDYHNGGIWPFICGFYIAALVAAKKYKLAGEKLQVLTEMVKLTKNKDINYGFNEWIRAGDGEPMGQDWQTWSAALYLYAAKCVEAKGTPFFDDIRSSSK